MQKLQRWVIWSLVCLVFVAGCATGVTPSPTAQPTALPTAVPTPTATIAANGPAADGSATVGPGTAVSLVLAADTVARDGTVTLTVQVENAVNLAGVDLRLAYDAGRLEVVDADPATEGIEIEDGDLLSPDFVIENLADAAAGTVVYVIAQTVPHTPASGSGALARVVFRGVAPGAAEIKLVDLILADAEATAAPYETRVGTVTVTVE